MHSARLLGGVCLTCLPGKLSAQTQYPANWDGGMSVKWMHITFLQIQRCSVARFLCLPQSCRTQKGPLKHAAGAKSAHAKLSANTREAVEHTAVGVLPAPSELGALKTSADDPGLGSPQQAHALLHLAGSRGAPQAAQASRLLACQALVSLETPVPGHLLWAQELRLLQCCLVPAWAVKITSPDLPCQYIMYIKVRY